MSTSTRNFPCAQCGAGLVYEPGTTALKCPYCGAEQAIPHTAEAVEERSFEAFFREGRVPEQVLAGATGERRCTGCGAQVIVQASIATELCPFCGTHFDNPITTPEPMIQPWGVLPFAIAESGAKQKFRQWVGSRWFAPNNFKRMADLGRVNGLYVPYWTYDAMTWSFYSGERGDAYYVTVGSGKNRRTERRIRWSPASGRVDHWFDDVLVCASKSLPEKTVRELEPWDLPKVEPFRPDFLSGYRTERYQVGAPEGFDAARAIMDAAIRRLVQQDIGGDEQRIHSLKTQIGGVTFKHLLLPVWLAAYRYGAKTFRVLVNARTGEVQGERPWSWIKITLFVLMCLAIVGVIVAIAQRS